MSASAYLKRRGKGFSFQIRIPAHLRRHFGGRDKITHGLDTQDRGLAEARALQRAAAYRLQFKALEGDSAAQRDTTRAIYASTLQDARDERPELHAVGDGDDDALGLLQEALRDQAEKRGIGPDDALPPDFAARVAALKDYRSETEGNAPALRTEYALPFSDCAARYLDTKRAEMKKQTAIQHEAVYRLFASFFGDKAMSAVRRVDTIRFFEAVKEFHPHWGRSPQTKERSFAELKGLFGGKGAGLSRGTLDRYLSHLSGAWVWAKRREEVRGENPFEDLWDRGRRPKRTGWVPFEVDELNRLFKPAPAQRWLWEVALVGLYSGMRLNEICSLTWADIRKAEGVWFFDITAAKSEAGVRPVPVHSKLAWLLKRRSKNGAAQVWPELSPGGPDEKHSWYYSKRFTEWRRKREIDDPKKVFHSLRKNTVRCLERAKVVQTEAAEIIGHEKAGITYRVYNPDGLTMRQRRAIIELINYPGFTADPSRRGHGDTRWRKSTSGARPSARPKD